jgi:hypothetical protein
MPYVNGHPVPPLIPATHVLVYFPHGILGLQKVYVSTPMLAHANGDLALDESAHEPVFLEADGSLRLDQDGEYFLPNFVPPGGGCGAEETAAAVVDSAVGRVEHHVTRLLVEDHPGARPRRAGEDGAAASTNQRPRQAAVRFEEREPESQGHTPHPAHSDAGSSNGRGLPSDTSDQAAGRDDKNPDRLTKSVLFDRAADLVPNEANEDEAALFQSQRRCALILYLFSHIIIVGAWATAILLDDVLRCPCGRFGLWTSCSVCGLNTTLREPPPPTKVFELDSCFSTSNFAECDAPNFSNIRNMLVASTFLFGSNAVIVLVDLACGITPRRPFYPFYFLVLWSMGLATWVILGVAATSPSSFNLSQLECEMQSNVANSYFTEHKVLLYHPLDRTRWSTERMDEVGIVGSGIRSYGADCEFSWTVGLASMSWVVYTVIGIYYFYSRYSAWNELTARRVAETDATTADGKPDCRGHTRTSSFTDGGRMIAAERARRKKQHQRTNSGGNRPLGSEQRGGTDAIASDGMGELGRGFSENMGRSSSKNLDRAATASPDEDPLGAAAVRDKRGGCGDDGDGIELEDVAHVRSWIAGDVGEGDSTRGRPPLPAVRRAGSKGPEVPRSTRRGRLISPARDEL